MYPLVILPVGACRRQCPLHPGDPNGCVGNRSGRVQLMIENPEGYMTDFNQSASVDNVRRRITCGVMTALASLPFSGVCVSAGEGGSPGGSPRVRILDQVSFVEAGELRIAYAEVGQRGGVPVLLLHGWPYDIQTYAEVALDLAASGFHVFVPYLRGFGPTRFVSQSAPRNGQQAVLARDVVAFMDALGIERALIGGCDWGARTANIVAALHPQRCTGLVSVSGYLIGSQAAGKAPLSPKAEFLWWYQFYFATERGKDGYKKNRTEFARLIWQLASPSWKFTNQEFLRSAASLDNPDHVDVVIDNYRWRMGLSVGDRTLDLVESALAAKPLIAVPTITLEGDANGAPHPDARDYASMFTGAYEHRLVTGGIGHNLPQEAPRAFADAVRDLARRVQS